MTIRDEASAEVEALRKVPFFEGLTTDDLERIGTIGERRTFDPGQPIVTKDEKAGGLFVILSGTAAVDVGGTTHRLGAGSFFGEMALLAGKPRSATVTAAERVEALAVETMYFKPFLMKNPSVAVALLEGVAERLREVQDRIEQSGSPRPSGLG
jgi:CRP-like cAMP-binding protein